MNQSLKICSLVSSRWLSVNMAGNLLLDYLRLFCKLYLHSKKIALLPDLRSVEHIRELLRPELNPPSFAHPRPTPATLPTSPLDYSTLQLI